MVSSSLGRRMQPARRSYQLHGVLLEYSEKDARHRGHYMHRHSGSRASADQAADAASSANDPSIEHQLSDLKDMLDKGLITQQDYDAKKKQLLGEM